MCFINEYTYSCGCIRLEPRHCTSADVVKRLNTRRGPVSRMPSSITATPTNATPAEVIATTAEPQTQSPACPLSALLHDPHLFLHRGIYEQLRRPVIRVGLCEWCDDEVEREVKGLGGDEAVVCGLCGFGVVSSGGREADVGVGEDGEDVDAVDDDELEEGEIREDVDRGEDDNAEENVDHIGILQAHLYRYQSIF